MSAVSPARSPPRFTVTPATCSLAMARMLGLWRSEQQTWTAGLLGTPVLADALASLEGRIVERKTVGSHSVMFVEVVDMVVRHDGDGLIYFDRNFHRLARVASTPALC